jgi:signal-transduction protein with cAMP-binding, CBS, and nucleotidyltransferase domain
MTLEPLLRTHKFTQGLTDSQIASLAALATEASFEENEMILEDGRHAHAFFLVTQGSVAVELRTPRFAVCVEAVKAGEAFGWSALLDQHETAFQVRARERTVALRLDAPGLRALCRKDPALEVEILLRVLHLVAGRVRATEVRFAEMCGVKV